MFLVVKLKIRRNEGIGLLPIIILKISFETFVDCFVQNFNKQSRCMGAPSILFPPINLLSVFPTCVFMPRWIISWLTLIELQIILSLPTPLTKSVCKNKNGDYKTFYRRKCLIYRAKYYLSKLATQLTCTHSTLEFPLLQHLASFSW
jgi:hypothetical protein